MGSVAAVYVSKASRMVFIVVTLCSKRIATVKYQLADIPLPDGILRVDKVICFRTGGDLFGTLFPASSGFRYKGNML